MRTKLKNIITAAVIPVLFYFFISAFSGYSDKEKTQNPPPAVTQNPDGFLNIIQNMDYIQCHNLWISNLLHLYGDSLGYNAVHVYPNDNLEYGRFLTDYNDAQINKNNDLINAVSERNLKFFYEQTKLSSPCYGQRLVYEVPKPDSGAATNNGFSFGTATVSQTVDSGRTVLYSPQRSNHNPELLCSDIYENLQHSDFFGRQNDRADWYLKPMVRANLDGVDNSTQIFRIDVHRFNEELDTSIVITAYNFRNNSIYLNNYTEKFYEASNHIELPFSGDTITGINKGRNWESLLNCGVDFKIYTFGYVDFWFDKLTVDDKIANDLFETPRPTEIITDELSHIGNNPNLFSYYMDEVTYSQLPCVKYVMDRISEYNENNAANIRFMVSESNWMATHLMRDHSKGHKITLDWLKPRILNVFAYELWGGNNTETYIPYFALRASDVEPLLPDYWKTQNYNTYNDYLQTDVLGSRNAAGGHESGAFIYQIAIAKSNIQEKSSGTMMYVTPQMQGEMRLDETSGKLVSIREPLNEEIEAQTMCALAHGAQGLFGYIFQTRIDSTDLYKDLSHVFGLYGWINGANNGYRRVKNHYGENKWEFIKEMNGKINHWIPTLDNINWMDGFSTHNENANHRYINDIKSIYRSPSGIFNDGPSCPECDNVKYWEEGFFEPKDITDRSKYFIMVNRRCAPEINGINAGDIRNLKIKLNPEHLPGFNNWKLINVENDSVMITLDKNADVYYDAGVFQPGEGKLLKLAPVMQEGGTFVCDEVVDGKIFNCYGSVSNGGYSLDLSHSTISFADGVSLGFGYGGYLSISGDTKLQGLNGGRWHGIYAENIGGVAFERFEITDINSGWAIQTHDCEEVAMLDCKINTNPAGLTGALIVNNTNSNFSTTLYNSCFYSNNATFTIALLHSASGSSVDYLDNNSIITNGNSASGLFLTNECALNLFNNNISGFSYGINMIGCTGSDLWKNTIISNRDNSIGINASVLSNLNLTNLGELQVGGLNNIANYGSGCVNIMVDNSSFTSDYGQNQFNVVNADGNYNYDGYGNFVGGAYVYYSRYNCFNGPGGSVRHDVQVQNFL